MTCNNCWYHFCWVCEGHFDGWSHDSTQCKIRAGKMKEQREREKKYAMSADEMSKANNKEQAKVLKTYKEKFAKIEKEALYFEGIFGREKEDIFRGKVLS